VGVGEFGGGSGWGVRDGERGGVRLTERSSREMVRCTVVQYTLRKLPYLQMVMEFICFVVPHCVWSFWRIPR
jgi:hypothetical protein